MTLLQTPIGIEIEYMLVQAESLEIAHAASQVLEKLAGKKGASDAVGPEVTWSNELVDHVLEVKVTRPVVISDLAAVRFAKKVHEVQIQLRASHAIELLPSGMHPWMHPAKETQLWSGEYSEDYLALHQNFDCFTHGFANLQSLHINIPFASEAEFGELLRAIRLVLPLIPALAASSPVRDGKLQPTLDSRVLVYVANQKGVPEITGEIIPEQIYEYAAYKKEILEKMYRAVDHLQAAEIMQTEQLNARGCIARFDRNTLEIRVCDSQESVLADFAVVYAVLQLLAFVRERLAQNPTHEAARLSEKMLKEILLSCAEYGENAKIEHPDFCSFFGFSGPTLAGDFWKLLVALPIPEGCEVLHQTMSLQLKNGTLASRIRKSLGSVSDDKLLNKEKVTKVYRELTTSLFENTLFKVEREDRHLANPKS
jgi:carboxylate-amine ligase